MTRSDKILAQIGADWKSSGEILSTPSLDGGADYRTLRELAESGAIQSRPKFPRGTEYRLPQGGPIEPSPITGRYASVMLALKVSGGTRVDVIAGALRMSKHRTREILHRLLENGRVTRTKTPRPKGYNGNVPDIWRLTCSE